MHCLSEEVFTVSPICYEISVTVTMERVAIISEEQASAFMSFTLPEFREP